MQGHAFSYTSTLKESIKQCESFDFFTVTFQSYEFVRITFENKKVSFYQMRCNTYNTKSFSHSVVLRNGCFEMLRITLGVLRLLDHIIQSRTQVLLQTISVSSKRTQFLIFRVSCSCSRTVLRQFKNNRDLKYLNSAMQIRCAVFGIHFQFKLFYALFLLSFINTQQYCFLTFFRSDSCFSFSQ